MSTNINDYDQKPKGESQKSVDSSILIHVASAKSRKTSIWTNGEITFDELEARCSQTVRTSETEEEYKNLPKETQGKIKDRGAFLPGHCIDGKRKSHTIRDKQILTFDVDFADIGFWSVFLRKIGSRAFVYSTHSHTKGRPRLRLVILLDRVVTADEYEAIMRKLASILGIEQFDSTTYDFNRFMYLPTSPIDGEFIFESKKGTPLSVDTTLSLYNDYRDVSEWPVSEREKRLIKTGLKKQSDPLEKEGLVGQYCRTYTVPDAIEKELQGVYEPAKEEDRYTFLEGSTAGGAICYDDKFLYSHHATDPISGTLRNAFDLVRIHKFGHLDGDAKPDTPINKLPSFIAMMQHAEKDPEVRRTRDAEKLAEAGMDFVDSTIDWMAYLDADKRNNYETSYKNIRLILENDEQLKGRFGLNQFSYRMEVLGALPWNPDKKIRAWSDEDWSGMRCYLGEAPYNLQRTPKLEDVVDGIMKQKNAFHPIRDYLGVLTWDGTERIDTLFVDYLGAADNEYVRAVTRKALIACAARVMEPGIKFDNIVTLVGKQGAGKSTIVKKLGRDWFSDNFSFHMLSGGNGKQAQEQIQGVWILEIGEMAGLRKAEAEAAKSFLSAQVDEFRPSHGKEKVIRPRQFVPFGTSNDSNFLKHAGGNRRIWPVDIHENRPILSVWDDLTDKVVDQIWAEALEYYGEGETLHLPEHIEKLAHREQENHTESDDRAGLISEFLDSPLPVDLYGDTHDGEVLRNRVCVVEIWEELFGRSRSEMTPHNTKFIHDYLRSVQGWEPYKSRTMFQGYGNQRGYKRTISGS